VLASNGLGGFSGGTGLATKRWLLQLEGAVTPKGVAPKATAHSAISAGLQL
jgi:hypothetical protein